MRAYGNVMLVLSGILVGIGGMLIVRGVRDGNALGIVVGAVLVALGVARIQVERRRRGTDAQRRQ